ncbi:MAG: CRISPR-associated ring nuclease [Chloroflexota bacterium]
MFNTAPALVATLGLQPQIITRSLDLLLDDEIEPRLGEVIIVHTAAFPRQHPHWASLEELKQYLKDTYPQIRWRWAPIQDENGETVHDVETPDKAELTFRLIYNEVKRVKRDGRRLHGLIAGGRKSMIVYTMVSAQLLFDVDDRLWHLFSVDEGPTPHSPDSGRHRSHLVEIPVMHLAGLMPMVRQLILDSDDPTAAIRLYREHEDVERIMRLREFYESCDETDQKILLLAYRGYSNSQIADEVFLSQSRITTRINSVAERFYTTVHGRRLSPYPGHIRLRLLHDMRPFLNKLIEES